MSYSLPSKIQGILKLKRDPFWYGIGWYEDINGVTWDIRAVYGSKDNSYVCACPRDSLHPYFGSTAPYIYTGIISQSWLPYRVEIIGDS